MKVIKKNCADKDKLNKLLTDKIKKLDNIIEQECNTNDCLTRTCKELNQCIADLEVDLETVCQSQSNAEKNCQQPVSNSVQTKLKRNFKSLKF